MHKSLKYKVLVLLTIIYKGVFSQLLTEGKVIDAGTKLPVPYCAVGVKLSNKGCLSNEEGIFRISGLNESDTVVIINISYKTKRVAYKDLVKNYTILLEEKMNLLSEVVVRDNDKYLYDMVERCRKNLIASKKTESKVYFALSTEIEKQPVELLECYYNGEYNNAALRELNFKNGRVGIAPFNDRYFVSKNTSKAISFIDLAVNNNQFPFIPFQLNEKKLRKHFKLKLLNIYNQGNEIYQLLFTPLRDSTESFKGELWIDWSKGQLVKIKLEVNKTRKHPFLPLFPNGKIESASLLITKVFDTLHSNYLTRYIDFTYQLNYKVMDTLRGAERNKANDSLRLIKSKGIMYFYDYDKLFRPLNFEYNEEFDDYRKITSLSYNEQFWTQNNGLVYSDKMKNGIIYFAKNGKLINYRNDGNRGHGLNGNSFFENNNLQWSAKTRVFLKQSGIKHDTLKQYKDGFLFERYKIKAQIFLDVNEYADTVSHFSTTVFDVYQTFYDLPEENQTNCFINIYFDLVEIERRNMETILKSKRFSATEIDSIYRQTLLTLDKTSAAYFKEVYLGKNFNALKKWNEVVKQNLQIDNIELFELNKPQQ